MAPDLIGLCERLSEASLAKQIEMLEAWMLGRVRSLPYPGRLGEALAAFLPSQPRSMQALVSELAVSRRTAERLLREQTGNTLGQLQAWARVRQARRLIKLEHAFNLTEIGLTCGYYDQSHFIREFKNATTFTPTEYRKRQRIRVAQGEMALGAQGQTSGEYGFGQSMAPRTASARP